jgi:fructose-1,6-bisphosphatase I
MSPTGSIPEVSGMPKTVGTTLVGYLLSVARSHMNHLEGGVTHTVKTTTDDDGVQDLITLLTSITGAVKSVGALVRNIGISPSGRRAKDKRSAAERATEEIEAINKRANSIWIDALLYSQKTCVLVSEDVPEPVIVEEGMQGKYAVVFDPLTGLASPPSQDMGCIFGIFRKLTPGKAPGLEDIVQPGRNLFAAGYALYGSCTVLMFSVGDGVHAFTLDASLNEFILTEEHVKIPFSGNIYSINEGRTQAYDHQTQEMLKCLKAEPALDGSVRTCRYIGSMVADIHRTIIKGGIFMYPPHQQGYPDGRLKLLYEAGPMAFLVTQAGGSASTGNKNITDIQPESIHTKVPVFLGSEDDVNFACGFYRTAPWGRSKDDPMFLLRRTLSIEERDPSKQNPIEDDGVICFHAG